MTAPLLNEKVYQRSQDLKGDFLNKTSGYVALLTLKKYLLEIRVLFGSNF